MRIESAIEGEHGLHVVIDGYQLFTNTKYTILEMGYALYTTLPEDSDEEWLRVNGDTIPADPEDGRRELCSGNGRLITADPILFALAYESWWNQNCRENPQMGPVSIPTFQEAVEIVRNRKILNDFNQKFAGTMPGAKVLLHSFPRRLSS